MAKNLGQSLLLALSVCLDHRGTILGCSRLLPFGIPVDASLRFKQTSSSVVVEFAAPILSNICRHNGIVVVSSLC